jgi:PAS domain-containing protein
MNYTASPDLAQAIFEGCPDAQFLLDATGERVLDANGAAQRLCGFALRDLISTPIRRLLRHGGRPGIGSVVEQAVRPFWPHTLAGCRLQTFQASVRARVDVTVTRLAVKPTPFVLLTVRPSRAVSLASPAVARKLRRLVAGVAPCLWSATVSPAGEVRFDCVSPAVRRVTGRPARHFGRRLDPWREIVHPLDRDQWQRAWAARLLGRQTDDEYRIVWPDGSPHWVIELVRAQLAGSGQVSRLYGTLSVLGPPWSPSDDPRRIVNTDVTAS